MSRNNNPGGGGGNSGRPSGLHRRRRRSPLTVNSGSRPIQARYAADERLALCRYRLGTRRTRLASVHGGRETGSPADMIQARYTADARLAPGRYRLGTRRSAGSAVSRRPLPSVSTRCGWCQAPRTRQRGERRAPAVGRQHCPVGAAPYSCQSHAESGRASFHHSRRHHQRELAGHVPTTSRRL